ncbi:hypothetical protein [Anaerolentibacter hominis]|uniref:cell division protein FtsQ/DivIB n=1 Tax=Anaerolentibacter hominis TaxID=3079009 RepID=UPI0031B85914
MEEDIKLRVLKEKKKKRRSRLRLRLAVVAGLVFLAAVFLLVFRVKNVEITGNTYYTEEQLKDLLIQDGKDRNTLYLYMKIKNMKKNSIPFIDMLDVDFVSPGTLKIGVYEKPIVGCVRYMGQYIYFDKDGVVVETAEEELDGILYIGGMNVKGFALYQKMQVEDGRIFDTVRNLAMLIKKYELNVDKIQFGVSGEVTLYAGDVVVPMGRREIYDEPIAELSKLLPKTEGLKGTLDMTNFVPGQKQVIFQEN